MKVHLDACCVSRLTDDQAQQRIRAEAEAIEAILGSVRQGKIAWIVSPVLAEEIQGSPQIERRRENGALLAPATQTIEVSDLVLIRARQLEAAGYGGFDALHLACAESGRVDVLLTTDDKFVKRAARGEGNPRVPVRNPVSWLEETSL
jgi:predicted nucleic acid-binding protein